MPATLSVLGAIVVIATIAHVVARLVNPLIPRPARWIPFYAATAGLAWASTAGSAAGVAAALGAGLGAATPMALDPMSLLSRASAHTLQLLSFATQYAPGLFGGLAGGLLGKTPAPGLVERLLRLGIRGTGAFTAGFVGAAAGHLSWGWIVLEDVGREPLGRTAVRSLGLALWVAGAGVVGGLAGVCGAWLRRGLLVGAPSAGR